MADRTWIGFALISAAGFAAMGALVRVLSGALPEAELVFFRNAMALVFLLPLLIRQQVRLATRRMPLHLLRAVSGLAAMYLYFHALARLPLADALLLNYTSPIFVAAIAMLWMHEQATRHRLGALAIGFAGLLLLFRPDSQLASAAGLIGLGSGLLAGIALACVKRLSDTEPGIRIVSWFALLSTGFSALPLFAGHWVWPSAEAWAMLLAMGLAGSVGQLGLTAAYARAPASRVSPLGYSSLLFAGLIGYLFWDELPDAPGLIGDLLIVGAGLIVAREQRTPAPQPPSAVPAVERAETR